MAGIGPGVIPPSAPYGMPKDETMLPELLTAAGYNTAAIGKWCVVIILLVCHTRASWAEDHRQLSIATTLPGLHHVLP